MNNQSSDLSTPTVELISSAILSPPPRSEGRSGVNKTEVTNVGNQLQRAREARRWTRADIAGKLRLNISVITALEESDYARLPFPIFVRGYLRSYANLLNLPPEPLIAAYDGQSVAPPAQIMVLPRHQSRGDRWWRYFTYIVVLGLIGLVGLWWQNRDAPEPKKIEAQQIAPAPHASGEITKRDNPRVPDISVSGPQPRELVEIQALGPPPEDAPAPVVSPHEATVLPSPLSVSATPAGSLPSINTQPTTDGAQNTAGTSSAETSTAAPKENQPMLTVQVTKDTRVKIKDGKRKVLFDALVKAGQPQSFQGNAPFKVRLGRVDGVSVNYNGQPFDFSNYIKGNTAHFTVGKRR
ncbi:cytoskeleton protein RodZ [Gammaproteobacteria bacterium]